MALGTEEVLLKTVLLLQGRKKQTLAALQFVSGSDSPAHPSCATTRVWSFAENANL